jgi:hypothetical protein
MARSGRSRRRRPPVFAAILLLAAIVSTYYINRSRIRCDRLSIANMGFFLDEGVTGFAVYPEEPARSAGFTAHAPRREQGHRTWRHAPGWYWRWWEWGPTDNTRFTVMFPAWPIPLALTTLSLLLVARWLLRTRTGRCLVCGYDLNAHPLEAPCPECGQSRLKTPPAPLS